jgi:hypothetical protein
MTHVVSIFYDRDAARAAERRLVEHGVAGERVHVRERGVAPSNETAIEVDELAAGGIFHEIGRLIDKVLGAHQPPDKATTYEDAVRRRDEVAVVVDAVDADEIERAEAILREAGASEVVRD